MSGCTVTIRPGRNAWLLARTDRDGASEADVLQSAVAFLQVVLGQPASAPYEVFQLADGRSDVATAVLGSARPVVVSAERGEPIHQGAALPGQLIKRAQDCDPLPLLRASKPWWVRVGFDWRAGEKVIPWPTLQVGTFGKRVHDSPIENDWVLTEARFVGEQMGPDQSWVEEAARGVKEKASEAVVPLAEAALSVLTAIAWAAGGLLVLGGVALLANQIREN